MRITVKKTGGKNPVLPQGLREWKSSVYPKRSDPELRYI